jgi:hypothetical protein
MDYRSKLDSKKQKKEIDQYIEEAKAYKISNYFKKGFYLDVKDDFNWCVAQIVDLNLERDIMVVHFDNWSNKYDEVSPRPD